jgi:protein-S-isoprenylcysteine O-methyltransferase Ste14
MLFEPREKDWLVLIAALLVWSAALITSFYDFFVLQKAVYHFDAVMFFGWVLLPIGIAIEAQARVTLGRYYSYRIRVGSGQPLIQRGIYRHICHPAYLGTILGCVATPLVFHSIYGFALMLLLIPCLLYWIRMEETCSWRPWRGLQSLYGAHVETGASRLLIGRKNS